MFAIQHSDRKSRRTLVSTLLCGVFVVGVAGPSRHSNQIEYHDLRSGSDLGWEKTQVPPEAQRGAA
jgi:hypothetical protein